MGTKLYVGNLNYNTSEESLRQAFGANGREVASVSIIMDRETGRSRGFAFVEMATAEGAAAAMRELDGADLDGRTLRINEARERDSRGPSGPRPGGFGGPPSGGGGGFTRGPRPGGFGGPPGGAGGAGGGGFGGPPAGGGGAPSGDRPQRSFGADSPPGGRGAAAAKKKKDERERGGGDDDRKGARGGGRRNRGEDDW